MGFFCSLLFLVPFWFLLSTVSRTSKSGLSKIIRTTGGRPSSTVSISGLVPVAQVTPSANYLHFVPRGLWQLIFVNPSAGIGMNRGRCPFPRVADHIEESSRGFLKHGTIDQAWCNVISISSAF